jgi:hypothetical protein
MSLKQVKIDAVEKQGINPVIMAYIIKYKEKLYNDKDGIYYGASDYVVEGKRSNFPR